LLTPIRNAVGIEGENTDATRRAQFHVQVLCQSAT
jgi:hypothetical protein